MNIGAIAKIIRKHAGVSYKTKLITAGMNIKSIF